MAIPAAREDRMNALYCALGRFVVSFSYVPSGMVQALLSDDYSAESAVEKGEANTKDLINEWHDKMRTEPGATSADRSVLAVIHAESTRVLRIRNYLFHGFWAERLGPWGGLMLLNRDPQPRRVPPNKRRELPAYVRSPTLQMLESYCRQANILAEAIIIQCNLGGPGDRSRLAIAGTGEKRVLWVRYANQWCSSDDRASDENPRQNGKSQV